MHLLMINTVFGGSNNAIYTSKSLSLKMIIVAAILVSAIIKSASLSAGELKYCDKQEVIRGLRDQRSL